MGKYIKRTFYAFDGTICDTVCEVAEYVYKTYFPNIRIYDVKGHPVTKFCDARNYIINTQEEAEFVYEWWNSKVPYLRQVVPNTWINMYYGHMDFWTPDEYRNRKPGVWHSTNEVLLDIGSELREFLKNQ